MTSKIKGFADFIIESRKDITVTDGDHKVTMHARSEDDDGHSDTYTVHKPDGTKKKATIYYDKHSNEDDEIDHKKVNKAFGLPHDHRIGKKLANGMNGMGSYAAFEVDHDSPAGMKYN